MLKVTETDSRRKNIANRYSAMLPFNLFAKYFFDLANLVRILVPLIVSVYQRKSLIDGFYSNREK
jgi:hypothetical protein